MTSVVAATGAPVNTGRPSITGDAIVGDELTAENGTWSNAPTSFRYQWLQCDRFGGACVDDPRRDREDLRRPVRGRVRHAACRRDRAQHERRDHASLDAE